MKREKKHLFGLNSEEKIIFKLNETEFELNNMPFELNYTYFEYSSDLFEFIIDEKIQDKILIEFIVGLTDENLKLYKQIDFEKSFGTLEIEPKKGIIIKIPEDFNDNLYDYSIIRPYPQFDSYLDIQIEYDNIKYEVPWDLDTKFNSLNSIIPLFKLNPYSFVLENSKDSNKSYFITMYNKNEYKSEKILIKKPKLFSELKLNTFNLLPSLKGEDLKYYYQIKIPKGDFNYSYIQSFPTEYLSISELSFTYPILFSYYKTSIENFLINKNKDFEYLNYYDTENLNYINIATNGNNPNRDNYFKIFETVEQIDKSNKIKIKFKSLSYNCPNNYKYILLINLDKEFKTSLLIPLIFGNEKLDKTKSQTKLIIDDDDGSKQLLEYEFKIDIKLKERNSMLIVPIFNQTNLIDDYLGRDQEIDFYFSNPKSKEKEKDIPWGIITIIIIIAIIFIIIIIIIIKVIISKIHKKDINIESVETNPLNQELNNYN